MEGLDCHEDLIENILSFIGLRSTNDFDEIQKKIENLKKELIVKYKKRAENNVIQKDFDKLINTIDGLIGD